MQQIIAMLLVLAIAAVLLGFSELRRRKILPYIDAFAVAFCEAADHALQSGPVTAQLGVKTFGDGSFAVLPREEQPEELRALFDRGVDGYIMERMRTMYEMRDAAQAHLGGINFVGKRINGVLNRCYDLANIFFSIVNDPSVARKQSDLDDFQFFAGKQAFLRTTTLASIVSGDCKAKLAAQ